MTRVSTTYQEKGLSGERVRTKLACRDGGHFGVRVIRDGNVQCLIAMSASPHFFRAGDSDGRGGRRGRDGARSRRQLRRELPCRDDDDEDEDEDLKWRYEAVDKFSHRGALADQYRKPWLMSPPSETAAASEMKVDEGGEISGTAAAGNKRRRLSRSEREDWRAASERRDGSRSVVVNAAMSVSPYFSRLNAGDYSNDNNGNGLANAAGGSERSSTSRHFKDSPLLRRRERRHSRPVPARTRRLLLCRGRKSRRRRNRRWITRTAAGEEAAMSRRQPGPC